MTRRRSLLIVAAALLALTAPVGPAVAKSAAKPKLALAYAPAAPNSTDAITVTFTAGRLAPDERYVVGLIGPMDNVGCTAGYPVKLPLQRPGNRVRVRLTPNGKGASGRLLMPFLPSMQGSQFCAGRAEVDVSAFDPDGKFRRIAHRPITVAKGPEYPAPPETPTRITVLDGSSVTVRAPGRPDRTMGLAGVLSGPIPGPIKLNTDIAVPSLNGTLALRNLAPDPLCAGPRYPTLFGTSSDRGTPSSLLLRQSGDATVVLVLAAPSQNVAGCAFDSSFPGSTSITLTGKVPAGVGLTRLPLTGTVTGVPIATGVTAEITVNLLVNVDLSGRPPA